MANYSSLIGSDRHPIGWFSPSGELEVDVMNLKIGATNIEVGATNLEVGRCGTKADWMGKIKIIMLETLENSHDRRLKPSLWRKNNGVHSYGT